MVLVVAAWKQSTFPFLPPPSPPPTCPLLFRSCREAHHNKRAGVEWVAHTVQRGKERAPLGTQDKNPSWAGKRQLGNDAAGRERKRASRRPLVSTWSAILQLMWTPHVHMCATSCTSMCGACKIRDSWKKCVCDQQVKRPLRVGDRELWRSGFRVPFVRARFRVAIFLCVAKKNRGTLLKKKGERAECREGPSHVNDCQSLKRSLCLPRTSFFACLLLLLRPRLIGPLLRVS